MSDIEDNSEESNQTIFKRLSQITTNMAKSRSRHNSLAPEVVVVSGIIGPGSPKLPKKISDSPRTEIPPKIRLHSVDSPNAIHTPTRSSSTAKKLIRSAGSSPQLGSPSKMSITPIDTSQEHGSLDMIGPDTPGSNPDTTRSPWIGGTGLGNSNIGKSGRVIERIMSENDKYKREIRSEIARREEMALTLQNAKNALEPLQAENARLNNIKSIDDSIIARRERKIEDLKAELEHERQKRLTAEKRAVQAEAARDEHEQARQKQLQSASESEKHASNHAEILRTSHQQLSREYRQRLATTNKTVLAMQLETEEDRKRLAKMDTVTSMMKKEIERQRKMNADLLASKTRIDDQNAAQVEGLEDDLRKLKAVIAKQENENERVKKEMLDTLGQMRWVMQLKQLGSVSPPLSPGKEQA